MKTELDINKRSINNIDLIKKIIDDEGGWVDPYILKWYKLDKLTWNKERKYYTRKRLNKYKKNEIL